MGKILVYIITYILLNFKRYSDKNLYIYQKYLIRNKRSMTKTGTANAVPVFDNQMSFLIRYPIKRFASIRWRSMTF